MRAFETTSVWGLYDREALPRWTLRRLTLLGDAVHAMLPHMAEGTNQALGLARLLESSQDIFDHGFSHASIARRQPACNGQGIVILGSVVTPGLYPAGVQRLLDAHPGAFYLRTDQTCPSLRQATPEGNPIYAVFVLGGTTQSQICARVLAAGDGAYGKWLNTTTDQDYVIQCNAH